ncbi:hypothetical protein CP02DC21_1823, partial [Chlamydia psittaci 02DC21]
EQFANAVFVEYAKGCLTSIETYGNKENILIEKLERFLGNCFMMCEVKSQSHIVLLIEQLLTLFSWNLH